MQPKAQRRRELGPHVAAGNMGREREVTPRP